MKLSPRFAPRQRLIEAVLSVCFASIYRCVIIHNLARIDPSCKQFPSSSSLSSPYLQSSIINTTPILRVRRPLPNLDNGRTRHKRRQRLPPHHAPPFQPRQFQVQLRPNHTYRRRALGHEHEDAIDDNDDDDDDRSDSDSRAVDEAESLGEFCTFGRPGGNDR